MPFSHIPPRNPIRKVYWTWRMKIEATFALSMLDDWEKALVVSLLFILASLFYFSLYQYLPTHLSFLRRRYAYYVYGSEKASITPEFVGWGWRRVKDGFGSGVANAGKSVGKGKVLMETGKAVSGVWDGTPTQGVLDVLGDQAVRGIAAQEL